MVYIATVLPFHSDVLLSVHVKSTYLQMAGLEWMRGLQKAFSYTYQFLVIIQKQLTRHEVWQNVNTSLNL